MLRDRDISTLACVGFFYAAPFFLVWAGDAVVGVARSCGFGMFLAVIGGLEPDNVAEAISTAIPDTVDVASGVERFPGGKDPDLTERFVKAAANAFAKLC